MGNCVQKESKDISTLTHYALRYLWNNNFSAPVKDLLKSGGRCALDIGCGSGTWILEMSYDYPSTSFVGIGMLPIFPNNIKPQNVEFLLFDNDDGLPFEDNKFDFVHMRMMGLALTEQGWPEMLNEIVRVLKPGGWFECMESGGSYINAGPIAEQLNTARHVSLDKLGINPTMYLKLPKLLEDLCQFSITEVKEKEMSCCEQKDPTTGLASNNTIYMREVHEKVMDAFKPMILPELTITGEEYDSKHLTIVGLLFSLTAFIFGLLYDIFNSSRVTVPLEGLISVLYWTFILYDEQLLLDPGQSRLPILIDMGFHLIPAICLWIDFLFFMKEFKKSHNHIFYILLFAFSYSVWVQFWFFQYGTWPYPILAKLETQHRIGFYACCSVLFTAMYHIGALAHSFFNKPTIIIIKDSKSIN
nr:15590_t:CDS:2 [Entrophospora candida]